MINNCLNNPSSFANFLDQAQNIFVEDDLCDSYILLADNEVLSFIMIWASCVSLVMVDFDPETVGYFTSKI